MHRHIVLTMLAVLPLLYAVASCAAAASGGAWQEDQRRCMIYLPIKGGRIAIADDEGVLWIDVSGVEAVAGIVLSAQTASRWAT
jgi:hypothetical protein